MVWIILSIAALIFGLGTSSLYNSMADSKDKKTKLKRVQDKLAKLGALEDAKTKHKEQPKEE